MSLGFRECSTKLWSGSANSGFLACGGVNEDQGSEQKCLDLLGTARFFTSFWLRTIEAGEGPVLGK